MERISIPTVGVFNGIVFADFPGASEHVEYQWAAARQHHQARNLADCHASALAFACGLGSNAKSLLRKPLAPCGRGQGEGPEKTEVIFRSILSRRYFVGDLDRLTL
ncbi:MAG TPA: hypothetical protein VIK18_08970 [Pirellulales bacterium]